MKKLFPIIFAAMLCGCCTVTVCQEGEHDIVNVENSALQLFGLIPIFSGDPDYPNREVSNWFSDTLSLDVNMRLLDDYMRANGYHTIKSISTYKTTERALFFFFRRDVLRTSAELIR